MVSRVPLVMVALVVALVVASLADATIIHRGSDPRQVMQEPGTEYLHDLNSELVSLLRQNLPHINTVNGASGPRLDMPLSGCRDSLDCHHRFTNYLGLLVRMMETGKRK
ncbi:hypothetical protein OTU49_012216 [Cherax quadricarinatus]|uniref:Uncharacterized protein n=1 Tax=Cherax quadricarinatus TaxID=27406 RepID=A0AAW0VYC8_CHEQU|nr:uncharacterized protein LOC128703909 [Cherax quadricarinatus]